MKMSIKHRLYLAFLAATGLVVVSMFLITKFSFERSLLRYVNTMEQERLVRLETLLKEAYLQHRSWDFLHGNRRLWKHLLMISRHENIPFATRHEFSKRGPEPAPPGFRPRKRAAPPCTRPSIGASVCWMEKNVRFMLLQPLSTKFFFAP